MAFVVYDFIFAPLLHWVEHGGIMKSNYEKIFREGLNVSRPAVEQAIEIARNACTAFANRLYSGNTLTQFIIVMDDIISDRIDSMFDCEDGLPDLTDDQAIANAVINCFFESFSDLLQDEDDVEDIGYEADGNKSWYDAYIHGEYSEEDVYRYLYDQIEDSIECKESVDNTVVIGLQEIPISLIQLIINTEADKNGSEMTRSKIAALASVIGKDIRSGLDIYDEQLDINMLDDEEYPYLALACIFAYQAMVKDPFGKDTIIKYSNIVDNVKTVGDMQIHGTLLSEHMNQISDKPNYFYIDWESMLDIVTGSNGGVFISLDVDHTLLNVKTAEVTDYAVSPNPDGSIPVYLEKVEYIGTAPCFKMIIRRQNENHKRGDDTPVWLVDKEFQMNMNMDVDIEVVVRSLIYIKHLCILSRNGDASDWDEIEKCARFDNKQWEDFLKDKPVLFDELAGD